MAPTIGAGTTEAAALQSEIQNELMRRDKAEQGDNTLAEYITVMLINHKTSDQINEELADLQGIDFDPTFTPWIFEKAEEVVSRFTGSTSTPAPVATLPQADISMDEASSSRNSKAPSNARLFSNAVAPLSSQPVRPTPSGPSGQVAGVKRGFSPVNEQQSGSEAYNKRRSLGSGGVPTAPRAHRQNGMDMDGDRRRGGKRSLLDRMGGPPLNPQAPEFGPGRSGGRNNFGPQGMPMMDPFMMGMMGMQNGFNFGPNGPDQAMMQEMFRQNQATMEQMQSMMFQMAQQMGTVPQQPYTTTISGQPPQQLGKHTISGRRPATLVNNPSTSKTAAPAGSFPSKKTFVAPPSRPTSQEICKYGVGCTNRSCGFSHPSPVATLESGMVLKTDACPEGLKCTDKDCPYSHVSPSQALGDAAGQSRVPCKFGNKCNNPACSFRHEDAAGNLVPTPALSRSAAVSGPIDVDMADPSQHDELDITLDLDSSAAGMASRPIAGVPGKKMDGTLGSSSGGVVKPMNGQIKVPCRFGEGCTRGSCRFQHGKACRFGKKCFDPRCTFVHPADRQLASSIANEGFNNYKGEKTLVDREFVKDESAVETVLPGGGDGSGEAGEGMEIKVESA